MTAITRKLSLAFIVLLTSSSICSSMNLTNNVAPPKPPAPPPPPVAEGSRNQVDPDEFRFAPVRGAHSKSTALLLNACRAKISKPVSMSVEWSTHYGRTGWWCKYKLKSAH